MRTLLIPLQMNGRGGFATTDDAGRILRQQIIDLLITFRYERVFLPLHGCNLGGFLFAPINETIMGLKSAEIRDSLVRGISFGTILDVRMEGVVGKPSTVRVDVTFKVTDLATEVLQVTRTISGLVDEETPL